MTKDISKFIQINKLIQRLENKLEDMDSQEAELGRLIDEARLRVRDMEKGISNLFSQYSRQFEILNCETQIQYIVERFLNRKCEKEFKKQVMKKIKEYEEKRENKRKK